MLDTWTKNRSTVQKQNWKQIEKHRIPLCTVPSSSSPFQFPDEKLSPSSPIVSLSKQINFSSLCRNKSLSTLKQKHLYLYQLEVPVFMYRNRNKYSVLNKCRARTMATATATLNVVVRRGCDWYMGEATSRTLNRENKNLIRIKTHNLKPINSSIELKPTIWLECSFFLFWQSLILWMNLHSDTLNEFK
jgi:hypothetical protein